MASSGDAEKTQLRKAELEQAGRRRRGLANPVPMQVTCELVENTTILIDFGSQGANGIRGNHVLAVHVHCSYPKRPN
jgi:hypothetical protein